MGGGRGPRGPAKQWGAGLRTKGILGKNVLGSGIACVRAWNQNRGSSPDNKARAPQARPPTLTKGGGGPPTPREELCQQPSRRPPEHLKSFIGRSLLFTISKTREQMNSEHRAHGDWSRPLGWGPSPHAPRTSPATSAPPWTLRPLA